MGEGTKVVEYATKEDVEDLRAAVIDLERVLGILIVVMLDGEPALDMDYKAFAKDQGYDVP